MYEVPSTRYQVLQLINFSYLRNMKTTIILLILLTSNLYSLPMKFEVQHSLRIPENQINFTISSNDENYYLQVKVFDLVGGKKELVKNERIPLTREQVEELVKRVNDCKVFVNVEDVNGMMLAHADGVWHKIEVENRDASYEIQTSNIKSKNELDMYNVFDYLNQLVKKHKPDLLKYNCSLD